MALKERLLVAAPCSNLFNEQKLITLGPFIFSMPDKHEHTCTQESCQDSGALMGESILGEVSLLHSYIRN